VREQGEGGVAVPGVVAADLVVVEAGLVLGALEAFLDGPAGPGDADQLLVFGSGRGGAQVVGQFRLLPVTEDSNEGGAEDSDVGLR
jgi:hypothetical protein